MRPEPCEPDDEGVVRRKGWVVTGLVGFAAMQLIAAALQSAFASGSSSSRAFVVCVVTGAAASVGWFAAVVAVLPTLRQYRARGLSGEAPPSTPLVGGPVYRFVVMWGAIVGCRAAAVVALRVAALSADGRRSAVLCHTISELVAGYVCIAAATEFGVHHGALWRAAWAAKQFWPADAHPDGPPSPAGPSAGSQGPP